MVITIGRECGCDADEIGIILGQRLHIPCYNRASMLELAREKGVYEKYPYFFSEVPAEELMNSLNEGERKAPHKAMASLVEGMDCILVGRCGNYSLRDRADMVSIYLTGNKEARVSNMAEKREMSTKKAKEIVEKTDSRRREYQKYYTGEEWGNARNYNLCLDVTKLGVNGTIAVIESYLRQLGMID